MPNDQPFTRLDPSITAAGYNGSSSFQNANRRFHFPLTLHAHCPTLLTRSVKEMSTWIKNRTFLTSLLMGGLVIFFLVGIEWYATMTHFLRTNDVADQVSWRTANINIRFLEARRAE